MGRKRKLGPLARKMLRRSLLRGEAKRRIAPRLGVDESTVRREAKLASESLARAVSQADLTEGKAFLAEIMQLHAAALRILTAAEAAKGYKDALGGIREARGCLELLGKAAGLLKPDTAVQVNVNVAVQSVIQRALTNGHTEATFIAMVEADLEWQTKPLEAKLTECKNLLSALEAERCLPPASI